MLAQPKLPRKSDKQADRQKDKQLRNHYEKGPKGRKENVEDADSRANY